MLNELYQAGGTPSLKGFLLNDSDPRLKPLPNVTTKQPAYKLCLGDGPDMIVSIETLLQEQVLGLLKYETDNGASFPFFNLPPYILILLENIEYEYIRKNNPEALDTIDKLNTTQRTRRIVSDFKNHFDPDKVKEFLLEYASASEVIAIQKDNTDKVIQKLNKCLIRTASDLWTALGEPSGENASFEKLHGRLIDVNIPFFREMVFHKAVSLINTHDDWLRFSPLIGLSSQIKDTIPSVSVILDIEDYGESDYPVANTKTMKWINERLLSSSAANTEMSISNGKDAYGNDAICISEKLPSARVGALANVILRSMVKESPCQFRYGKADSDSFIIGKESRRIAKVALETLSQPEYKGHTWNYIGEKEILFAYPTELLDKVQSVAMFIRGNNEYTFKAIAKKIIDCLHAVGTSMSDIEIRVFALKKMDIARTKVIYNRNISADKLEKAANEWQFAGQNIPDLYIGGRESVNGEIAFLDAKVPYPMEVADIINRVWGRDGKIITNIHNTQRTDCIELLLNDDIKNKNNIRCMLSKYISGNKYFLIDLGQNCNIHKVWKVKLNDSNDKVLIPAVLGLLLYKLGHRKEIYMKNTEYLVGNLLSVMDSLHYLYCKQVRTNDKDRQRGNVSAPKQLIGNTLMTSAMDSPVKMLALLAQRSRPYIAWAKTNNTEDKGLSMYYLKISSELTKQIALMEISERMGDEGRAMLLLGYLAGPDKTTVKNNEEEK